MTVSKFLILIIVFLNTFFSVHSQENIPFKSSHIKNKSDLKFAKNEIKKGDEFFYNARNALYKLFLESNRYLMSSNSKLKLQFFYSFLNLHYRYQNHND